MLGCIFECLRNLVKIYYKSGSMLLRRLDWLWNIFLDVLFLKLICGFGDVWILFRLLLIFIFMLYDKMFIFVVNVNFGFIGWYKIFYLCYESY